MAQTASDYLMKNKSLWSTSHNNQHAQHLIQLHICTTQLFHVTHIYLKLLYTLTLGPQGKHCVNARHTHANGKYINHLPLNFNFKTILKCTHHNYPLRLVFFHQYNQANAEKFLVPTHLLRRYASLGVNRITSIENEWLFNNFIVNSQLLTTNLRSGSALVQKCKILI